MKSGTSVPLGFDLVRKPEARATVIYLDYNATTPLCDEARQAMLPYLDRFFGNPSSVHVAGREARAAIDNSRDKLAALLRVKPNELVF
ncbi:MAG TPA: aminotransferase class V-fold PLP-dependent enzyme, partial [Chthoniobacterales bacterium]|nr:aminotransferase class V-fold PLP-dependent enzyme [Chthoniobacterales bacterium]